MPDQRVIVFDDDKGSRQIYTSAYDQDQIRQAVHDCKMTHLGSQPITVLASKLGGELKA